MLMIQIGGGFDNIKAQNDKKEEEMIQESIDLRN
jgi:hypothetical protein